MAVENGSTQCWCSEACAIPYGTCHCGCGRVTRIPYECSKRDDDVTGRPKRFVSGHNNVPRPLRERFEEKVDRSGGPDACHIWTAYRNANGYGTLTRGDRPHIASRVSWELEYGSVPDGMDVLHRCDNPPCVNVAHLFLGTAADNMHDMQAKGRQAVGERFSHSIHTESIVREIRRRKALGESNGSIALALGLNRRSISDITRRHTWKHVV